jgi:hypothetical protein
MITDELLPASMTSGSSPVQSLYKRIIVILAPLLLVFLLVVVGLTIAGMSAATAASTSTTILAPCTPGFCLY